MPSSLRRARRLSRATSAARSATTGIAIGAAALIVLAGAAPAVAATRTFTSHVVTTAAQGSPVGTLVDIAAEAHTAMDAANDALAEAAAVTSDIAASGLDVAVANTVVDTAALREHLDRLAEQDIVPALLVPGLAEDTATETRRVLAETARLRNHLEQAQAQKAAEEAAAAAAAAAQRAAEEAAAEAQRQAEAAAAAAAALAAANTPEGAKALAQQMAAADYGWGADQFSCLVSLWQKESGWNYQAYNASSGATGIPQALPGSKMASAGADWQSNAATQIAWGLGYISAVYGAPCGAWNHSQATNWY